MSHPYYCPTHQGLYVYVDGLDGCQHETCIKYRNLDIPGRVVMGIGETHREYYKKAQHRKFDKDMNAYSNARKSGLQPEQVSAQAVERAEKRAYREDRMGA